MFPDEKASYQISEEATWVDFMISALGGQLISLSSKTIIVKKCDGSSIARLEKESDASLEEKKKLFEDKFAKDSSEKLEALNQERSKFEKEKESLILAAVEKKKAEFEMEYAAKRNSALDEIVQKRMAEIDAQQKFPLSKDTLSSNGKTEGEISSILRKELESDYLKKSKTFEQEYAAKKNKELKRVLLERSEEIEKEFYKKKEREATLAIEKYLAKHQTNGEVVRVVLPKKQ